MQNYIIKYIHNLSTSLHAAGGETCQRKFGRVKERIVLCMVNHELSRVAKEVEIYA